MTFTPKSHLDRGIAESLEDFRKGRSYGPFDSASEMVKALETNRKQRAKPSKRSRQ